MEGKRKEFENGTDEAYKLKGVQKIREWRGAREGTTGSKGIHARNGRWRKGRRVTRRGPGFRTLCAWYGEGVEQIGW